VSEPLVVIDLFAMPVGMVDRFVENWEKNISDAEQAPGFRGIKLHRAVSPEAKYPVVSIAQWNSVEDWQLMMSSGVRDSAGLLPLPESGDRPVAVQPNLYTVVHTTVDPTEDIDV
jgi:hypothetical protein